FSGRWSSWCQALYSGCLVRSVSSPKEKNARLVSSMDRSFRCRFQEGNGRATYFYHVPGYFSTLRKQGPSLFGKDEDGPGVPDCLRGGSAVTLSRVVSCDDHMDMYSFPPQVFGDRLPAALHERGPRMVEESFRGMGE